MKSFSLFILLLFVVAFSQNKQKLDNFKKQSQVAKMECYKVTNPQSASEFMDFKLNSLSKNGFQAQTIENFQDGREICAKKNKNCFAYYKNGYFRYVNREVKAFKKKCSSRYCRIGKNCNQSTEKTHEI